MRLSALMTFILLAMGVAPAWAICNITCPETVQAGTDPSQCGAVVTWPAPTLSGTCGKDRVTCSPPSGSFFPIDGTTVTCSVSGGLVGFGTGPPCSFDVYVLDLQAPVLTCSGDVAVGAQSSQGAV